VQSQVIVYQWLESLLDSESQADNQVACAPTKAMMPRFLAACVRAVFDLAWASNRSMILDWCQMR
jgi:hypothetical protein